MLEYKLRPPSLPACFDRTDLVRRALAGRLVLLAAPAGHGKTCLAAQIGPAGGGPTAWFTADELDRDAGTLVAQLLAALTRAWPDLGDASPSITDEDAALPLLAATLQTLAGPGCIAIDDAHLTDPGLLDAIVETVMASAPGACRLVVCTRGSMTPAMVRAEVAASGVVLAASDLAFTAAECATVAGLNAAESTALRDRTGGWPLAVGLASRAEPLPARLDALAEVALADLPEATQKILTALARIPRFPARLLNDPNVPGGKHLPDTHPALVERVTEQWWAPRLWLRDALAAHETDPAVVSDLLRELRAEDPELASHLLLAVGREAEAVPGIEEVATIAAREGRWGHARAVIASAPENLRTFDLDLLLARANALLAGPEQDGHEDVFLGLVERSESMGPTAALRARAALAEHYRMAGDARFVGVCEVALGELLEAPHPDRALLDAEASQVAWSRPDLTAAAEMLRLSGQARLASADPDTIERGRVLIEAAFAVAAHAGSDVVSPRAWFLYIEALLFLRRPLDVIPRIAAATRQLQERGHGDAALRLTELAILQYLAGDHAAASATIEVGAEWADRTGYRVVEPPLAAVAAALAVADGGFTPERAAAFDDALVDMAAHSRLAFYVPAYAAEFGALVVGQGEVSAARRYLAQAEEEARPTSPVAPVWGLRCRRLEGLILLAEGRVEDGRTRLVELREQARAERRVALVELLDRDLGGSGQSRVDTRESARLVNIHVLRPDLLASVEREPVPALRGYPVKLLASLIAARGVLTIDAAMEALWPDADPEIARNRLHGILLRLRRSLGLTAAGPITCTDGLVRLATGGSVEVDAWQFERAARSDDGWAAARLYRGDLLDQQFAYDDHIDVYRRDLRSQFVTLASGLLADPPVGSDPEEIAALARQAVSSSPGDDALCLAAIKALVSSGNVPTAREMADTTCTALSELGIDPRPFTAAANAAIRAHV